MIPKNLFPHYLTAERGEKNELCIYQWYGGLYDFSILKDAKEETVKNPYGEALLYRSLYNDQNIYFLPRHGKKHSIAPHEINYRANIAALKLLGVDEVLAFCSVGSMDKDIRPGSLVFLRQFIDMTWGRGHTFVTEGMVNHVTMDEPYCPRLTDSLLDIAAENNIPLQDDGVYSFAPRGRVSRLQPRSVLMLPGGPIWLA